MNHEFRSKRSKDSSYYGVHAYRSNNIPNQKSQPSRSVRPWFNKKFDMQLAWGGAEDVLPYSFQKRFSPKVLRKIESKPTGFESVEFHQRIDQEKYRHAVPALRTRLLLFIGALGKFSFFAFLIPAIFGYGVAIYNRPYGVDLLEYISNGFYEIAFFYHILPLILWSISSFCFRVFPFWSVKASKGPKWELNRRTGLVTLFRNNKNSIREESAPFYEFDAYLTNEMLAYGQVVHTLYLVHRYSAMMLPIGDLIGKTKGEECFALWDMVQNFMDTSRPLPDIPLWEEHRPHDPVTAEHDRRTGRPPRYWRDMDDETWQKKEDEMMSKVMTLTTIYRPNLMREHVQYAR